MKLSQPVCDNQFLKALHWGFFFFFSFSLCSFPAFCWANQTLVWLKPELHSPGDCSDFSFSIQQATTSMCSLCQKMSLLHLCLSPPHRDSNELSWLWPFTLLGLGLGLGTLQIFLLTIWTHSKLSKCNKRSKWDTNLHIIVPISHKFLL